MAVSPEALRNSRDSYAIVLRGIIRDLSKDPLFAFFLMEGKDSEYFRPRIGAAFAGSVYSLQYRNCRGKSNMKPLLNAVRSNNVTQQAHILFFFDRDYENDLADIQDYRSYITDGYSIENYYTDQLAFKAVCESTFFSDLVSEDSEQAEIEGIVAVYKALHCQFHEKVALFNSWAWWQRHNPSSGSINLDKFVISTVFQINLDEPSVNCNYDLDYLNGLAPQRAPVSAEQISVANDWFDMRSCQMHNRGKQERDFLFEVFGLLISRGAQGSFPFTKVRKARKRISKAEMVGDLSSLASTPASLIHFLTEHRLAWDTPATTA